jgi:archaemetzincin
MSERVGVWSIYRNGDPNDDEASFRLCLLRTLKTATHETGHMFSLAHCTAYECNMCGSNSRGESDRRPVEFCPECLAKLCWATGADPRKRFAKLNEFCREQGLDHQREFYERSLEALRE